MQTAAIRYRVADFLKQHPPFQLMEDPDLLALVNRGRVKFHESDEFLCWQGSAYAPFVFVIQQGTVALWEEIGGKEFLRDICGPGDMIGVERFTGSEKYPYSAKSTEEVVVYALHAADFEPLLRKYPQASRYVEAHSASGAVYQEADRQAVHERFIAEFASHPVPLSCGLNCSVAEAAGLLREARAEAIAVMQDQTLHGTVTSGSILDWIANGGSAERSVQEMMSGPPHAVAPHTLVSDCVLKMGQSDANVLALTADGTLHGGLLRLVTAADLQPAFGDSPVTILREIAEASDIEVLRVLHLRARAFLLEQLTKPSAIDWLTVLGDRLNVSVIRRLLELAGETSIDQQACWCFYGAAGRRELLTAAQPSIAILCENQTDAEHARRALDRLHTDLGLCGYLEPEPSTHNAEIVCGSVSNWQKRFGQWIQDPIRTEMYASRVWFDMRPAFGRLNLWPDLEHSLREVLRKEPGFQQILANDCLSTMPPLTFFENAVVDDRGDRAEVFELQNRALGPLVEVGRVFAIANGEALGSSTLHRLERARAAMPAHDAMFRGAGETLRVLLYLQARAGLRLHSSGAELPPAQLSRFDRQVLKNGFRAIHRLLEFTSARLFWEPTA